VVHVVVPLCDNDLIDCGSGVAGRPGDLARNLYWGAAFGQRRFFDRARSGWTRVDVAAPDAAEPDGVLERVVYRREVPRAPFDPSAAPGATVEQLVAFEAVHGASIDRALERFWRAATEGGRLRFTDHGRARDVRVHVAGYAGHNRLMDGRRLPPPPPRAGARPVPSFVMACVSERYFGDALRAAGSEPLVMTRALLAPEGYVLDAITRALGDGAALPEIRARAVDAYARWQRLTPAVASGIFAKARALQSDTLVEGIAIREDK
jgi:hypothetical protein